MHALVNTQTLAIDRFALNIDPEVGTKLPFVWLPVRLIGNDLPADDTQVKEGPVDVVGASEVTRTWTVRAKTQQELADEKTSRMSSVGPFERALLKWLAKKNGMTLTQLVGEVKAEI